MSPKKLPPKKKNNPTIESLNKQVQAQLEMIKEQDNQIMSLTETMTIMSDRLIDLKKEEEGIVYSGALKMSMQFSDEAEPKHYLMVSRFTVNNPFIEFTYLSPVDLNSDTQHSLFSLPPRKKKEGIHAYIKRVELEGQYNVISEQHLVGSITAVSSLNFFMYKEEYKDEEMFFSMPPAPENIVAFDKGK